MPRRGGTRKAQAGGYSAATSPVRAGQDTPVPPSPQ